MGKVLFIPVSLVGGLLAGMVGRKVFEKVWRAFDEEEPPDAQHLEVSWAKLIPALALEGAIFRTSRGLADHGTRIAFYRATGRWPGEEEPDSE